MRRTNYNQSNNRGTKWLYGDDMSARFGRKSAQSNAMEGWRKIIPAKRADVKTTWGIGSVGLVVQILALMILVAPLVFVVVFLPMMGQEASTTATVITFVTCGAVAFGLMWLGFVISRPYVNRHTGAHFATAVFSNVIPILIGFVIFVLPLVLLFG